MAAKTLTAAGLEEVLKDRGTRPEAVAASDVDQAAPGTLLAADPWDYSTSAACLVTAAVPQRN